MTTGDVIIAQTETTLRSTKNETEMSVSWKGKGKIFFLKLFLPLLLGKMIKQSKAELQTFKRLIETKGSNFKNQEKLVLTLLEIDSQKVN